MFNMDQLIKSIPFSLKFQLKLTHLAIMIELPRLQNLFYKPVKRVVSQIAQLNVQRVNPQREQVWNPVLETSFSTTMDTAAGSVDLNVIEDTLSEENSSNQSDRPPRQKRRNETKIDPPIKKKLRMKEGQGSSVAVATEPRRRDGY